MNQRVKYSKSFERDYKWYLSISDLYNFDGASGYFNKKGLPIIVHDAGGVDAKTAFYYFDTQGKILPTKEPEKFRLVLRTKGSVNLHIKMYAQDRANGRLPKILFDEICEQIKAPDWFSEAVERQKSKYY